MKYNFEITLDDLNRTLSDIAAERVALDEGEAAVREAIAAIEKVAVLAGSDKPAPAPRTASRTRSSSKRTPKQAKALTATAGPKCGCGRSASHTGRCAFRRAQNAQGKEQPANAIEPLRSKNLAPCGRCSIRLVDGKSFVASSPDCPIHGTGLGTVQPGREQKTA